MRSKRTPTTLARIESLDTGHPIRDTHNLDVPRTAAAFRYFGGMADKVQGSVVPVEQGFLNYVLREPIGVVGQIVPWNFPLMFTSWKMGPALAAGNCVVLKPAELTPLSSLKIAELMRDVGFPPGVVNIVPGYGAIAGQYLAEHPGVQQNRLHRIDGNRAQNRRGFRRQSQARAARARWQRCQYRFRRCRLWPPPSAAAPSPFFTTRDKRVSPARACSCTKGSPTQFLEGFLELAASIRIGDPLDPATEMGPLTSAHASRSRAQLHAKSRATRAAKFCWAAEHQRARSTSADAT